MWITWDHRLAALLKAAVRVGVNDPTNRSEMLNGSPEGAPATTSTPAVTGGDAPSLTRRPTRVVPWVGKFSVRTVSLVHETIVWS